MIANAVEYSLLRFSTFTGREKKIQENSFLIFIFNEFLDSNAAINMEMVPVPQLLKLFLSKVANIYFHWFVHPRPD